MMTQFLLFSFFHIFIFFLFPEKKAWFTRLLLTQEYQLLQRLLLFMSSREGVGIIYDPSLMGGGSICQKDFLFYFFLVGVKEVLDREYILWMIVV